jgi:hypothetical protein
VISVVPEGHLPFTFEVNLLPEPDDLREGLDDLDGLDARGLPAYSDFMHRPSLEPPTITL